MRCCASVRRHLEKPLEPPGLEEVADFLVEEGLDEGLGRGCTLFRRVGCCSRGDRSDVWS